MLLRGTTVAEEPNWNQSVECSRNQRLIPLFILRIEATGLSCNIVVGNDLHGGNKSRVACVTTMQTCGISMNLVGSFTPSGARLWSSIRHSRRWRENVFSLLCSVLCDWSEAFYLAWHFTVSNFRTATALKSDSIFISVLLWGASISLGMAASWQLLRSQ